MWELAETLASRDEGAAEAEALFTEALEHERDHGGRRASESLAGILDWLGTLAEKRGDLSPAIDFARHALSVFEARKDAEGLAAITLGKLGRHLDASGDAAGAVAVRQKEEVALGQQLAHRRTRLPAGDPRIAATLAALALCLLR